MKIKTLRISLFVIALLTAFMSCKDDDDNTIESVAPRDRTLQQAADKDSIIAYLGSHYYNSSFFETGINHKYTDIEVSGLEEGESVPDGHTLLIDDVEVIQTTYLDVAYEYYILRLNQGGGDSPKFTDAIRVRYEGSSVASESVFDGVISPVELNLQGNGFTTFGTIKAWQLVMPSFSSALDFTTDSGVVNYNNFGMGMMFVPSGLAYFNGATTGLVYDNLIFKFELLQMEELDHDNDGVPSYIEDLDDSLDVNDDDTDEDQFPNYIDADDDEDGVLTINEDIDGDGDPTNDIGANGIPKYLDPQETESNETDE